MAIRLGFREGEFFKLLIVLFVNRTTPFPNSLKMPQWRHTMAFYSGIRCVAVERALNQASVNYTQLVQLILCVILGKLLDFSETFPSAKQAISGGLCGFCLTQIIKPTLMGHFGIPESKQLHFPPTEQHLGVSMKTSLEKTVCTPSFQ